MADDGGVLGNLPRSRPGRRSDKRAAAPGGDHSEPTERVDRGASDDAAGAGSVSGVARAVTSLAGGGARAAHGIARELLRRLPRP